MKLLALFLPACVSTTDALHAGKDVYLQKPMTYTIEEARDIAALVEKTKRVLQVGSQHTSDLRYHRAKEVIGKGWIGAPLWVQGAYSRNSIHGEWKVIRHRRSARHTSKRT